jgi:hypothetical protein
MTDMLLDKYPDAVKRIDYSELLDKIDKLFNNTSLLVDAETFEKKQQAEAQAMQEQNELAMAQNGANINKTNAEAFKQQREAMRV